MQIKQEKYPDKSNIFLQIMFLERVVRVDNLLNQYKIFLQEKDLSAQTIRGYINDLRKFINWYQETEGELPCTNNIGPLDLVEFKRYLQNKNQKPATINRAIMALSSFFGWCIEQGHLNHNPAINIKLLPEVRTAPKSLSRTEQLSLMRSVQSSGKVRDIAIITLLLHTGLRVSELCSLTTDDIIIRERSGHLIVRSGKGNKRREVPLNSTARTALKEWLKVKKESGSLFTGKGSDSLSSRSVEYLIDKYSYQARLEKITPHVLRHTFCKSLVDAGESLDRVALLAGHDNLNTTARYTMATCKDLEKSVGKIPLII